jgi:hypothetical protein
VKRRSRQRSTRSARAHGARPQFTDGRSTRLNVMDVGERRHDRSDALQARTVEVRP